MELFRNIDANHEYGTGRACDVSPSRRSTRHPQRAAVLPGHRLRARRLRGPRHLPHARPARGGGRSRRGVRLLRHRRVPRADARGVRGLRTGRRRGRRRARPGRRRRRVRHRARRALRPPRRGRRGGRTARHAALPRRRRPGGAAAALPRGGRRNRPAGHRLPARQRRVHPGDGRRTRPHGRDHRPEGRARRPRPHAARHQRRPHRGPGRLPLLQRPADRRADPARLPRPRRDALLVRRVLLRAGDRPRLPPGSAHRRRRHRGQAPGQLLPPVRRTARPGPRLRGRPGQGRCTTASPRWAWHR